MPIIDTANVQQVLQMSAQVEKLPQNIQQQPGLMAQQLEEDRNKEAELKQVEVQESENPNQSERSNPDSPSKKRRLRITRKTSSAQDNPADPDKEAHPSTGPHGKLIDVVI